jgi:hypothetical protein
MQACDTKGQERAMHTTAGRTQERPMNRQQILDLYQWATGVCFRHPAEGEQPTTIVKTLLTDGADLHDVRACADCVSLMEEMRRETAARTGSDYVPGLVGVRHD